MLTSSVGQVRAEYRSYFYSKSLIISYLARKPDGSQSTHKVIDGARVGRVELSNVGVFAVGVTSLVSFEGKDEIPVLAKLDGSPVPTTEIVETDLVRLGVRLGVGETVIVKTTFDERTLVEEYDNGCPVPTKVLGTGRVAGWDMSDKLELGTLETGSIGKIISSDVKTDLIGRLVGISVTFLGVLYSVTTPDVTVIYFVVCR